MALGAEDLIRMLSLVPLPGEGGFFKETYRSRLLLPAATLPGGYGDERAASTAIYYLLTRDHFSAMHRLRGDEVYHFYMGDPVEMLQLRGNGTGEAVIIGRNIANGMAPQVVVPAGVWQGSRLMAGGAFALLGTTMAPGFDARDFELGNRAALVRGFPAHAEMIAALTREAG
jgi:uncharacterized protein